MQSINSVTFSGNLGKDAESKFTPGGKQVSKFSLAVTNRENVNGEWTDKTMWLNVDVWGKEKTVEKLKKGVRVVVSGSLKCREFDGDDGTKKQFWIVNADQIEIIGGGGQRQESGDEGFDPNAW